MERLIRHHLIELAPYRAVEPLEVLAERYGIPVERVIKLDANENPYGCSPRVQRALAKLNYYHIYPDPLHRELREMLAEYTGIGREYIAVSNGSDELIDLILHISLEPGDKVINLPPTFGPYSIRTKIHKGKVVNIPRKSNFEVDIEAVKSAVDERTKVIFLANPNNPTGNATSEEEILELVNTGLLVVVDEAYYEFSGLTVASLVPSFPNLIVLRSFSKWAGLAGLRIGYGILSPRINEIIYKSKNTYNVSVAAQVAAKESLADLNYLKGKIQAIISERERLFQKLKEQGILNPLPSQANFILCRVFNGQAARLKQDLEKKGIFVRYFDTPPLKDMLRITVGKPEHTDALIDALNELFPKAKANK